MNIDEMTKGIYGCECGMDHVCPIDKVVIGENAVFELEKFSENYKHVILISDDNTYAACGERVYKAIKNRVDSNVVLPSGDNVVIPDEETIACIRSFLKKDTDLLIGVGSGVINDLCKYISFHADLPYFIVATAPSMDGFASVGAALILEGMKITCGARPPKAIFADSAVLCNAPMEMIKAGYGDIIGKFSCLNDWKLSAFINDEFFCQKVYDMTYETALDVKKLASKIKNRDPEAVGKLMEALVVVGILMSYVGNSRPASGSEHHLSHYFEITGILHKKPYFPHGIDVAYSAVVTAEIREKIIKLTPRKRRFAPKQYEKNIRRIYTTSADGILALQDKIGAHSRDDSEKIRKNWDEIKRILSECPTADEFRKMLSAVGLKDGELEKMYGEEKIADGILYAKDLKDRYTVLNLSYDYFR